MSEALLDALGTEPHAFPFPGAGETDVLGDDDAQLSLACCYELHYRSFAGVDERWEWAPELLGFRAALERCFVDRLVEEVADAEPLSARAVVPALCQLAEATTSPSLSRFMLERGTREHMREFCVHRSAYQLKEADPHTWLIPRLSGRAKAATVTIQYDEYGAGNAAAMHSHLFAEAMRALDLDATYGAYLDLLPAATLATGNLVSMFGLHRRWRGACVGHLALFEMTSVGPMSRYAAALDRLGVASVARRFYDVHVEADAWHEQIAQHDLVAGFVEAEPHAAETVMFGARALIEVERRMAQGMLHAWERNTTALLAPLAGHRVPS